MSIIAAFKVGNWDEEPLWEAPSGAKVTHASVRQDVEGDISGAGEARWLMCYRSDGTADYTGFQRVEGTFRGREGTLVLRSDGTFDGSTAKGRWKSPRRPMASWASGLRYVRGAPRLGRHREARAVRHRLAVLAD